MLAYGANVRPYKTNVRRYRANVPGYKPNVWPYNANVRAYGANVRPYKINVRWYKANVPGYKPNVWPYNADVRAYGANVRAYGAHVPGCRDGIRVRRRYAPPYSFIFCCQLFYSTSVRRNRRCYKIPRLTNTFIYGYNLALPWLFQYRVHGFRAYPHW
jgi:hypothetical protein